MVRLDRGIIVYLFFLVYGIVLQAQQSQRKETSTISSDGRNLVWHLQRHAHDRQYFIIQDSRNTTQETNQLAKLMVKLINSANQKVKEYHKDSSIDARVLRSDNRIETDNKSQQATKNNQKKSGQFQTDVLPGAKKSKEMQERASYEIFRGIQKSDQNKKGGLSTKIGGVGGLNIQPDLQYHNLLHEHIKQNFPDIKNLSAQLLMKLDIPKHLLEPKGGNWRNEKEKEKQKQKQKQREKERQKERKKKERGVEVNQKVFKRQAYHVAVAYHIYMRWVPKGFPLDPTANAKRLRQMNDRSK